MQQTAETKNRIASLKIVQHGARGGNRRPSAALANILGVYIVSRATPSYRESRRHDLPIFLYRRRRRHLALLQAMLSHASFALN